MEIFHFRRGHFFAEPDKLEVGTAEDSSVAFEWRDLASHLELLRLPPPDAKAARRDIEIFYKEAGPDFEQHAQPMTLRGRALGPPLHFIGGLATTGFVWKPSAQICHQEFDITVRVQSLAGYDGRIPMPNRRVDRVWVADYIRATEDLLREEKKGKVIGIGHSTGALVVLTAAALRPELFDRVVVTGPPAGLKNVRYQRMLSAIVWLENRMPFLSEIVNARRYPFESEQFRKFVNELERKNPTLSHVPIAHFSGMYRLLTGVVRLLPEIQCPVFAAHGRHDEWCSVESVQAALARMISTRTKLRIFENSFHSIMIGPEKEEFNGQLKEWLSERLVARPERGLIPRTLWHLDRLFGFDQKAAIEPPRQS